MAATVSEVYDFAHGSSTSSAQSLPVNFENTWIAMILAPRATPENSEPRPAAMPETWVPCGHEPGA